MKVIIILGCSFLLIAMEGWLEGKLAISGLLAVTSMACTLKLKSTTFVSKRLSDKFGKLWLAAEVILFVLVGAAVDIRYTLEAGLTAVLLILGALIFRTAGVWICTIGTPLSLRERSFCVIAKSDRSGSHRFCSPGRWANLRKNRPVCGRHGDHYHCSTGCAWNRRFL